MMDSNINIRVDSETKAQAQQLFSSLGMDMSTAVNMFLRQSIEFGGIPFVIRRYNEETEQAIQNVENGENLVGPFNSVEELWEDLNADDPI